MSKLTPSSVELKDEPDQIFQKKTKFAKNINQHSCIFILENSARAQLSSSLWNDSKQPGQMFDPSMAYMDSGTAYLTKYIDAKHNIDREKYL